MDETAAGGGGSTALVKALSHPVRARAFFVLSTRTASPKELAEELGVRLEVVSYHVRRLLAAGLIELVRREPRRGVKESYYRAAPARLAGPDAQASVTEVSVDERGAGELSAALEALQKRITEIEEQSASRMAQGDEAVRTTVQLVVLRFDAATRPPGDSDRLEH